MPRTRAFFVASALLLIVGNSGRAFAELSGKTSIKDPTCTNAERSMSAPVDFRRTGPVDFGPGTGAQKLGDSATVGMEYNLLFSGNYDAGMKGRIKAAWPEALTVTAIGDTAGGYFDIRFGLRMYATIYVLGTPLPIPVSAIIDDNEGHGHSTFTPWAWNGEGTAVNLNVSAWRPIYTYDLDIAGQAYPIELAVRYNMTSTLKTLEIGFPERESPTANLARRVITPTEQQAYLAPPRSGELDLFTRWKSQIKYDGKLEFRITVKKKVCDPFTGGLCTNVAFSAPEFSVAIAHESLPDPFDQSPHFALPTAKVNNPEIDLGDVPVGGSKQGTIELQNSGGIPLGILVSTPSDPVFDIAKDACAAGGSTVSIPVKFSPTTAGKFRSEVILSGEHGLTFPQSIVLSGRGISHASASGSGDQSGTTDGPLAGAEAEAKPSASDDEKGCNAAPTGHKGGGGILFIAGGLMALVARRRRSSPTTPLGS